MVSSAQFVSPKPALLPPGGQPGQPGLPGSGSAGGPSFSQFLNDQPEMLTAPAHTDPVPTAPDSTPPAANTAAANAAARRKEAAGAQVKAGTARPADATPAKPADAAATASDGADTVAETTATGDGQEVAQDDDQQASSLTEFAQLIGLAQPSQAAAAPNPAAEPTSATPIPTADAAATVAGAGRPLRAARGAPGGDDAAADHTATRPMAGDDTSTKDRRLTDTAVRPADGPRAKAIELTTDKAAAPSRSPSTDTLQATSARAAAETAAPRSVGAAEAGAPNFAALLAQSLPATVAGSEAAPAPAAGQVHAALHSPGFAPELAANVSLLAADGVQHAELQLNPADMGPVAVQIVVDGGQAQVSFHALHAETRQALEQSLPDLAAALQGQGLTLSGGGVFQQAPRDTQGGSDDTRGGDDRSSSRASGGAGSPVTAAGSAASTAVRRAAGLLDTFA